MDSGILREVSSCNGRSFGDVGIDLNSSGNLVGSRIGDVFEVTGRDVEPDIPSKSVAISSSGREVAEPPLLVEGEAISVKSPESVLFREMISS